MPKLLRSVVLIYIGCTSWVFAEGNWFASVGVASDYVWRGTTQTLGQAQVSGGTEYVDDKYLYVGAWVSNTNQGTKGSASSELDLYVGISGKKEDTGFDIGFISYQYLQSSDLNFEEIYAAFSKAGFTVKMSDGNDTGNYLEASLKMKLPSKRKIYLGFHVGRYNRDGQADYIDASASLHMNELTLTVSDTDLETTEDHDMKVYLSWEHDIEF